MAKNLKTKLTTGGAIVFVVCLLGMLVFKQQIFRAFASKPKASVEQTLPSTFNQPVPPENFIQQPPAQQNRAQSAPVINQYPDQVPQYRQEAQYPDQVPQYHQKTNQLKVETAQDNAAIISKSVDAALQNYSERIITQLKGDTCPEVSAIDKDAATQLKSAQKKLEFYTEQAETLLQKNNFLRTEERKWRLLAQEKDARLKKVEKELERMQGSHSPAQNHKPNLAPTSKTKEIPVPKGWKIKGIAPGVVLAEHVKSKKSKYLHKEDTFADLKITKIDSGNRRIYTDKGYINVTLLNS